MVGMAAGKRGGVWEDFDRILIEVVLRGLQPPRTPPILTKGGSQDEESKIHLSSHSTNFAISSQGLLRGLTSQ